MGVQNTTTKHRVGLVTNVLGVGLLLVFLAFGNWFIEDVVYGWATLVIAVLLTGLGFVLMRLSESAG